MDGTSKYCSWTYIKVVSLECLIPITLWQMKCAHKEYTVEWSILIIPYFIPSLSTSLHNTLEIAVF